MIARIASSIHQLLRPDHQSLAAQELYISCVNAARHPFFYQHAQLPDTVNSRLEMVMLHVALLVVYWRHFAPRYEDESRALIEAFFQDMDRHFREAGVADIKVGKRVRKLADLLYGRTAAYDKALEPSAPQSLLSQAVQRNIFREVSDVNEENVDQLADYIRHCYAMLQATAPEKISSKHFDWPAVQTGQA